MTNNGDKVLHPASLEGLQYLQGPPLIIRFGALGDMILTTAVLRALANRHGYPCEVVARGRFVKDVLQHLPFVGGVKVIWSNKAPYLINAHKLRLVRWLQHRKFSVIYLFQDDLLSQQILDRAGIIATASNLENERRINEHVIDHMARLAGFADLFGNPQTTFVRGTELRVTDSEILALNQKFKTLGIPLSPYIIMHPGYRKYSPKLGHRKRVSKHWPEIRWAELIRLVLHSNPDLNVLITGSAPEKPLVHAITQSSNDSRVYNLAGKINIRELFGLIHGATSMISVDTGTAHAAAALNCPLVVLFGKTDPRVNGPVSTKSTVKIVTGPDDAPIMDGEDGWNHHHSMMGITPQKVFEIWDSMNSCF